MSKLLYNEENLIDKLYAENTLNSEEFAWLIDNFTDEGLRYINDKASNVSKGIFGNAIFIRGLIEFTNNCKNNCYYCGIRAGNVNVERYRLNKSEILVLCEKGYNLGFRTFVLQGGEDPYFDDDRLSEIIREIKDRYPDCAITLSVGERPKSSYERLFEAGADRYLLRHETAEAVHYSKLHPEAMALDIRMKCLSDLKDIGFQIGAGFMVGSPYQITASLVEDLLYLKNLKPHMVGIGPFISHKDTPFRNMENGSVKLTLFLISIIRLMLPYALIPATTALSTLDDMGREKGILAGANVVMPNLSPKEICKKYSLYDNKVYTGGEDADLIENLKQRISEIGYKVVVSRGDSPIADCKEDK